VFLQADGFTDVSRACVPFGGGRSDTEAGRMLAKLYGTKTKPTVKYPKPKTKATSAEDLPTFVPAGGKADVNFRTAQRKEAHVAVPRVGGREEVRTMAAAVAAFSDKLLFVLVGYVCPRSSTPLHLRAVDCVTVVHQTHYAPIELRAGRGVMPKAAVDHRLEQQAAEADITFQPATKAVSTDAEKKRLATVFQFKGGKALPDELTLAPVEGHLPLKMVASRASVDKRREFNSAVDIGVAVGDDVSRGDRHSDESSAAGSAAVATMDRVRAAL
jgi:hypothetical protein